MGWPYSECSVLSNSGSAEVGDSVERCGRESRLSFCSSSSTTHQGISHSPPRLLVAARRPLRAPRCTELTLVWGRTDATCLQVKNSPNLFKTRESPPPSSWPRTVTLMASLYDVRDMSSSQPLYVSSEACYTHDVSQLSHAAVVSASPVAPPA